MCPNKNLGLVFHWWLVQSHIISFHHVAEVVDVLDELASLFLILFEDFINTASSHMSDCADTSHWSINQITFLHNALLTPDMIEWVESHVLSQHGIS